MEMEYVWPRRNGQVLRKSYDGRRWDLIDRLEYSVRCLLHENYAVHTETDGTQWVDVPKAVFVRADIRLRRARRMRGDAVGDGQRLVFRQIPVRGV